MKGELTMPYDNTNRGALFKNDEKAKDEQPDYRGRLNVDGVEFWLSGWIKTSKAGAKFMSLNVQPKQAANLKRMPAEQPARTYAQRRDMDDEIPF
jgi:uncharacterized protein (DUF736 family)